MGSAQVTSGLERSISSGGFANSNSSSLHSDKSNQPATSAISQRAPPEIDECRVEAVLQSHCPRLASLNSNSCGHRQRTVMKLATSGMQLRLAILSARPEDVCAEVSSMLGLAGQQG